MSERLSAFDLDGTLIVGNSSFLFGRFLHRQGHLTHRSMLRLVAAYLRHRYLGLSLEKLHQAAYRIFFKGRNKEQLDRLVAQFLDTSLPTLWYQPALTRLNAEQDLGHRIAILSSSPDFLVGALAARLNVALWQASVYPVDADGCLTGTPHIFAGDNKATRLIELAKAHTVDLCETIAYSDSILDLPFLLTAGRPVAVNPDNALRRWSAQHGWEML